MRDRSDPTQILLMHPVSECEADKGKPPERVGRKATGLKPEYETTVAGLPGEHGP